VLRRKMANHGKDSAELVQLVTLLQFERIERQARRIANEPRVARTDLPVEQGGLPDRFFELQDELRLRARELTDAASRRQAPELATAFGRLTETCVSCHHAYLGQ
jgi:hypothetical protein